MQSEQERDVTLVLKDGKEIRMSSNELSAVSDFFFTLQNTDMKERIEGIILLEHVDENVMRGVLEFTRSGSVCVTHENHAKDLIEAADYFLLPSLKIAAGRLLEQTLRPSNCISIHHFAERYQCEDLVLTSREFILSNFAVVAESREFLHLESQQVEDWICPGMKYPCPQKPLFSESFSSGLNKERTREEENSKSYFVTCDYPLYRVVI